MSKLKNFVRGIFSAEENSAATIEKKRLGKHSRTAVKMFNTSVLRPKELALPGIGQFAERMITGVEVYRMMYFVNVLKIDIVYVTFILVMIGIYDVLNNPLMGIAYDRTRTRWGKAKPYILLSMIPYYLATVGLYSGALFLGDRPGNDPGKIVFVFTMLMIQETFSTIYKIPRENLFALQSACPKDRIRVGLVNQYVGEFGAQIIYFIFIPLTELVNKGIIGVSMAQVFSIVAAFAASVGTLGNMAMAINVKERILLQPKPANSFKSLFYILKNKYLFRRVVADISGNWINNGYSWDVVTQQEIMGGTIPTLIAYLPYNVLDVVSIGLIPKVQKMFKGDNRKAIIFLRMWDIVCLAGLTIVGCQVVDNAWALVGVFALFHGLNALNNGPCSVIEAEVMREIADYTEYVTGERPDGSVEILTNMIGKVTAPLGAAFTVFLFKWSGYDPTQPMLPWAQGSVEVYKKVFFLYIAIDIIPRLLRVIPFFWYDLVGEKREQMYIELNARRAMMVQENAVSEELEAVMEAVETQANS